MRCTAVVVLLGALWGTAGCRNAAPAAPAIEVALQVAPQPPREGEATVTVRLTDPAGKPVTGADVKLEGTMSHPGMQPVLVSAREGTPGTYQAPLQFTMGGDWFIIVTATLADGRSVERQMSVPGVRPR